MEYEPYVNKLQHGDFTLLRADIYFSPDQQYDYYGRQVAYDGRIVNGMAPRVSNSRLSIPLPEIEVKECTNRQLIDSRHNLANCQWGIGTLTI